MEDLKTLWKETEEFVEEQERKIAEKYIHFLRKVAEAYIRSGKRVFFKENRVVHYGEGGFGWMIIESEDDPLQVFCDYVPEIRFETQISEREKRGYKDITEQNIEEIKYEI
jgi:hypothetical protein